MTTDQLAFNGTRTAFLAWLRSWNPDAFLPDLDASIARHPAGKGRPTR